MTIVASGPISLADIQTEMGGVAPISLSEYYANGAYTPLNLAGVPTSGLISMGSFYGKTKTTANYSVTSGVSGNIYGYATNSMGAMTPSTYKGYAIYEMAWSSATVPTKLMIYITSGTALLPKTFLTSITVGGKTYNASSAVQFGTNTYNWTYWHWSEPVNPFATIGAVVPVNIV